MARRRNKSGRWTRVGRPPKPRKKSLKRQAAAYAKSRGAKGRFAASGRTKKPTRRKRSRAKHRVGSERRPFKNGD